MDKTTAVYSADLRSAYIPCGDCSFEEEYLSDHDDIKRDIRRLDTELDGHERETDRGITELRSNYVHIAKALDSQTVMLSQLDKRMGHMEVEIGRYNNLRERLDGLEQTEAKRSDTYVPRPEFNQTMVSVRQHADSVSSKALSKADKVEGRLTTMVWGVGLMLAGISGVVGFIAARVFV